MARADRTGRDDRDPRARTKADWATLGRRIDAVHAEWLAAIQQVDWSLLEPGARADEVWGPWHVLSHTAGYLHAAAEVLDELARGQSVEYSPVQKWLADFAPARDVEAALDRAWAGYLASVRTAEAAYSPQATVTHPTAGRLDARGWVAMGAAHLREHIEQLSALS